MASAGIARKATRRISCSYPDGPPSGPCDAANPIAPKTSAAYQVALMAISGPPTTMGSCSRRAVVAMTVQHMTTIGLERTVASARWGNAAATGLMAR